MKKINRNMRCIEIESKYPEWRRQSMINRNMRCIEIMEAPPRIRSVLRLIET